MVSRQVFPRSVVVSEAAEAVPNRLNSSRMQEAELFLERQNNGSLGRSKPVLMEPLSNLLLLRARHTAWVS